MININETSTKRGIVWIIASIIGVAFAWAGKDPAQVMLIAGGVVGGLGLLPDNKG
jgi:hypothetical protein